MKICGKVEPCAGAIVHLLAIGRVAGHVQFGERGILARQQRFGGGAIAAARTGVDFNGSGHGALWFRQVFELYGSSVAVHNPREYQHVDLRGLGAQQAPARRRPTVAPEVRTSSIRMTRRPWMSALRSAATLKAPCTLLARCGRDSPICCSVAPDAPQRLGGQFDAALPSKSPAPARRTGCSGGSSRAASAGEPAPARRPRRAIPGPRAPSSGPSRAPDRCGPGISAHAPACARRRHSAPRRGRAGRPADWRSPPSTAIPGRDRRQRECRAAGRTAAR